MPERKAEQAQLVSAEERKLVVRRYIEVFEKRQDPRGKTYYWLAGEAVEEVDDPETDHHLPADVEAIREKYITITPLQYNLTAVRSLDRLQTWLQTSDPKR